jgi:adenosylhomocysteinase
MKKMKDQAIVCNIGHFDNEIQMDLLNASQGRDQAQHQAAGGSVHVPRRTCDLCAGRRAAGEPGLRDGHPSFVMSNSFANQTLAQLDLWKNKDTYKVKLACMCLPKKLDEEVARLHLEKIGVKLTTLTPALIQRSRRSIWACRWKGRTSRITTGTNCTRCSEEIRPLWSGD